ncbi:uncharacterized protein LOC117325688 [Pecten maximus]|uniref:uncharacterized protein LOC117325688 n=1 Tax=Pecten maximus TaxID=6579 RepID=UPI001458D11E|nr:uncharacterized protein LOC117325688 [Pecten maximus]
MTDNAGLPDNVSTMTEVSGLRSPSKSRPLGEVKDNIIYFDEDNQIQRPTNSSREGRRRRAERYSIRRMKEMRESLRQAALINIVAAVNEGCDEITTPRKSQSSVDPFTNTMAVLSNLVLNKDRTISIPKQQVFKEAPQKFSIKKPLFYKNSADEPSQEDDDDDEVEQRKRNISLSRTRSSLGDTPPTTAKAENISISVPLQQINEESKEEAPDKEWIDSPAKVRIARSWTPRRRFVSLNKRNDTRITTSIAKCDAVDIYESTDTLNGNYVTNSVPPQHRPNSSSDLNIYRAKSLPSIFPVKRRKSCALQDSPQILTNNEKVKVTAPFKPPVQKTVRENNIAADNPILSKNIQKLSLGSTVSGSSRKPDSKPSSGGFTFPEEQTENLPCLQQVDPTMSLECRSLTMTSQMMGGSTKNRRISTNTPAFRIPEHVLTNERDMMREIDNQFEELQKRISRKILNWSDRKTGPPSANQQDIVVSGYNVLGKDTGIKSSLSSAQSRGTNNSMRGLKRVKFVDEETSGYDDGRSAISSSVFWDDNERAAIRAQGVANKMHEPVRPIKPMSTNELIRLKKRLMPGHYNTANKHAKYNILDNNSIRISGMRSRQSTSTATSFTSSQSDRRSLVSETDLASFDGFVEFSGREPDATNRNSSKVPKSFGMSSFYPDSQSLYVGRGEYGMDETTDTEDDDGDDDDDDDIENIRLGDESFRVLKAIDLGTLSGYQNRRFKKPSIKETATTQHYVKIKMK